ncbi:UDP-N-acetylmuramoyl-L-alanyl-D-glutamate--2,6-diaminopimelate ligase [Cellulomonas hominis]|uniref:UDP-N-acetylmuramoyl-L-alanyl-D-glutamate--2, 6-diaminopimelate ligase n=1 Tax=Cellulomonas hominis TaxID=156981 RepID=UPI001B93BD35|nr:UDP-N-acetylmuramoyl-L-alanyl-D-glutamate--2,6-diaminopimelate ligase [Cellulomonas hominis]VTR76461.1 UDP-N-acetylmuramoyl-L-alanyl-D-glutamate--2, 6-diaminopimelate ligase [Cellulomonas hominis]
MTSPQGRLRPEQPRSRRVADLADAFGLLRAGAPVPSDLVTSGITVASGDVLPGDVFVAVPGAHTHGAAHTPQAVGAGAVAVVTDAAGAGLLADLAADQPALRALPVLVTDDPRAVAGPLAAWLHEHPGRRLATVGITGTNGKTTTTYFVDSALRRAHERTVVMGTVELRIGDEAIESPRTTVEAPVVQSVLALGRERGATAAAMEVSSHALALGRMNGLELGVAGFTNLQRDHLDFHGDMEGYFQAKAQLFRPGHARRGVVVVDDEWGRRLAAEAEIPVETVATHVGTPEAQTADWAVVDAEIGLDGVGSTFTLRGPDGVEHAAASPLPGLVNVSNAALAVVLAHRAGVDLDVAIDAVGSSQGVPGRMERVIERRGGPSARPLCLVDYAHTPDALVLALEAVRPITPGRLVLVFGSDGDRDQGKRPIMGRIAARLADVLVVTDENPRSEDPASIRAAILSGVRDERPDLADVHEATSRTQAIHDALDLATELDTIIITGKGHEPTQEIAGVFHRYNDRDVLRAADAALTAREGRQAQEQHA